MTSPLEKLLRFSQGQHVDEPSQGDELRELARAVHLVLAEACQDPDPAHAAELVYAAAAAADGLNELLYGDGLTDWVEATSAPVDGSVLLASDSATKPYGDVPYADPGYLGGRKRYPIDEKHVRAAWSYINQAKNSARYTASQLSSIKGKIKAAMAKHGHGVNVMASADGEPPVLAQLCAGEAWVMLAAPPSPQDIPMGHAPFTGTHAHAHSVTMTHGHDHSHQGDNLHGSQTHGNNAGGQKAWAAKGQDAWASRRYGSE